MFQVSVLNQFPAPTSNQHAYLNLYVDIGSLVYAINAMSFDFISYGRDDLSKSIDLVEPFLSSGLFLNCYFGNKLKLLT